MDVAEVGTVILARLGPRVGDIPEPIDALGELLEKRAEDDGAYYHLRVAVNAVPLQVLTSVVPAL